VVVFHCDRTQRSDQSAHLNRVFSDTVGRAQNSFG
jgi:hypothetical protein